MRDERILFPGVWHGDLFRSSSQFDKAFTQMRMYNPNSDANEDDVIDSLSMLIQSVEMFAVGHWENVARDRVNGGFTREFILKNFGPDNEKRSWDSKIA